MKIIKYIILGLILGWIFFYPSSAKDITLKDHSIEDHSEETVWTCSMHPQIQSPEEGDCPLCGMDLIPLEKGLGSLPANQILIEPDEINNAGIKTIKVSERIISKEISLQGKTTIDESSYRSQSAHFKGRITRSFINFSGQEVKKNDIIAKIYSPELITAQKEFLEAIKIKSTSKSIYLSTRKKLSLLNISEKDINMIENELKIFEEFNIRSDVTGIIEKINFSEGNYVTKGMKLFDLYSIEKIWFEFDLYEKDRPFVSLNDNIEIHINGLNNIQGKIDFIDPSNSIASSATKLRVIVENNEKLLRPGIYADGTIHSKLSEPKIVVPRTSILWTGKRSVAYVKIDSSIFELRNVTLGVETDDYYVIESGLIADEEVVYKALFTVDAAAQLQGKTSMMNSVNNNERSDISNAEVKNHTDKLISLYLKLKDQLVESNNSSTKKIAKEIHLLSSNIPISFYDTKQGQSYLDKSNKIKKYASDISQIEDIEEQRMIFEDLSNSIIELVDNFETGTKLYIQFCPMAFNDKGANWISDSNKIMNPYFGSAMLRCGNITKEY
jgi:Cu(I)/Ag(I) efflux system membrane fusion protein